ncbi:MAG: MaoC family dehydratase [Beijerinckiaceae bacterium]
MARLYFEDFSVGQVIACPPRMVSKDQIIAFATQFDPQDFHIDEVKAQDSFFGGLVASGWHTASLTMRMIADAFILDAASLGSGGIDTLKWQRPVRAGDTLTVRAHVVSTRESRSRPERGMVEFRIDVSNQHGDVVMVQQNWIMIGRRNGQTG